MQALPSNPATVCLLDQTRRSAYQTVCVCTGDHGRYDAIAMISKSEHSTIDRSRAYTAANNHAMQRRIRFQERCDQKKLNGNRNRGLAVTPRSDVYDFERDEMEPIIFYLFVIHSGHIAAQ